MGYTSVVFGRTRVELGHGYWAEVAPLTKAEDDECRRVLLGGELEGAIGSLEGLRARFHQREYTDYVLLYAIKHWNLDDDAGTLLTIDLAGIQGLADAHATRLLAVVRGLTAPLATAEARRD